MRPQKGTKLLKQIFIAASFLIAFPAVSQVIGEYEWEFKRKGDSCYAGVLSHSATARFQLGIENGQVAGFVIAKDPLLDWVKNKQQLSVTGEFDSGETVDLGKVSLVGRGPFEVGSQDDWAYFMFTEPARTGDKRLLTMDTFTIYVQGLLDFPEGYPLGTFPLVGAKEVLTEFAYCVSE